MSTFALIGQWLALVAVMGSLAISAEASPEPSSDRCAAVMRYLDPAHPTVSYELREAAGVLANAKFVEVDVTEVRNPERYALAFEVRFRPKEGAESLLGSFALYPPDNPGKFIVPTHGHLSPGGSVAVTMVVVDKVHVGPGPRVGVSRIATLQGAPGTPEE